MIDKRNSLIVHQSKKYKRRNKSGIKKIAIHHSATVEGSAEAFAHYHVNSLGWPGIGYHYIINKNGSVDWCNDLETISYHVGNSNSFTLGICMVGNFTKEAPTKEQYKACLELTRKLINELNLNKDDVLGHRQFAGYENKQCPSIDMDSFRGELIMDGWVKINGIWFYYDNGNHSTGWLRYKNKWYFLDHGGAMKTGWIKYKEQWYYLNKNGDMATGILIIDDKAYYLDVSGAMYEDESVTLRARKDGSLT